MNFKNIWNKASRQIQAFPRICPYVNDIQKQLFFCLAFLSQTLTIHRTAWRDHHISQSHFNMLTGTEVIILQICIWDVIKNQWKTTCYKHLIKISLLRDFWGCTNNSFCEMSKYTHQDLQGKTWTVCVISWDLEVVSTWNFHQEALMTQ